MLKVLVLIATLLFAGILSGQVMTLNGTTVNQSGGGPNDCNAGGYKLKGQANIVGNCISFTQLPFQNAAIWACDVLDLNQSFKLTFQANFDNINTGDGIAFVLQSEGVPTVLGGQGGGIGYSVGNQTGCLGGDCIIDPSVVVEFDIWDNSADFWDMSNPGLGNINDISCDHVSIQRGGVQLSSNALVPPACLLPGGTNVTNGLTYDVCIAWDVATLEYKVYFDSNLVANYNGDIRTNFPNPSSVFWGYTAASGGGATNLQVCNVAMQTNSPSPSCLCVPPVATATPSSLSICSGQTATIQLSSSIPGTTFNWSATDNPNVSGESTSIQNNNAIINTLSNNSNSAQNVTYSVVPTESGCTGSTVLVDVTVNPTPNLIVSNPNPVCAPNTVDLTAANITVGSNLGTLTYWTNPTATTSLINPNSVATSGTYYIVLDNGTCTDTATVLVVVNSSSSLSQTLSINSNYNGANLSCYNSMDGVANAQASGGVPGYQYNWSNGQTVATATGLGANWYAITITDTQGCTSIDSIQLTAPTPLDLNTSVSSNYNNFAIRCNGQNDGIATAIGSGGIGVYQYNWSSGASTSIATGLGAGLQYLTITDANNCITVDSILLTEPNNLSISTSLTATVGCDSSALGQGTSVAGGGVSPLSFLWSNGQTTATATGLTAGAYFVTATDINGCFIVDSLVYSASVPIQLSFDIDSVRCKNENDGSITVSGIGGTLPYTYSWNTAAGSQSSAVATGLTAGTYSVLLTDFTGCTVTGTATVFEPTSALTITATTTNIFCVGENTGTIIATGNGGTSTTGLLQYSVNNGLSWQNGDFFTGLAAGIYILSVQDENGCVADTQVVIQDANPFFISYITPPTIIEYLESLTVEAQLNDTTGGVTYSWNQITGSLGIVTDSSYQFEISPANSVMYEFVATNTNGCKVDSIVIIDVTKPRRANAPSAFTPNGDGVNDYFFIQGGAKVQEVTIFRIYDRWGALLYEGQNLEVNVPEQGWDGNYKGKLCTSGSYIWYADVTFKDGLTEQLKGDVLLLK